MKTFKILGLMLTYPKKGNIAHLDEMNQVLAEEALLPKKNLQQLAKFITKQQNSDLLDLQEKYVATFDRGRSFCLNLFEHVHGESRDRGQAMVDLAQMYHEKELFIDSSELPDYLPIFLEYLSLCSVEEAKDLLDDMAYIVATISAKLKEDKNDYQAVFAALEKLSTVKLDVKIIEKAVIDFQNEDNSLDALDKEWEEASAFTGDPEADCNSCDAFPNATEKLQKMAGGQ